MNDEEQKHEKWRRQKLLWRAKKQFEANLPLTPKQTDALIDAGLIKIEDIFPPDRPYEMSDLERNFTSKKETKQETTSIQPNDVKKEETKHETKTETKPLLPIPKETREQKILRQISTLEERAKLGSRFFDEIDEYRLTSLKEQLRDLHPRRGRALHLWRKIT